MVKGKMNKIQTPDCKWMHVQQQYYSLSLFEHVKVKNKIEFVLLLLNLQQSFIMLIMFHALLMRLKGHPNKKSHNSSIL